MVWRVVLGGSSFSGAARVNRNWNGEAMDASLVRTGGYGLWTASPFILLILTV